MSKLSKNPDFITRNIAGEALLVPVAKARADLSEVLVLEGVGGLVWELLDSLDSEEQVVAALVERCDVDTATATADVREFLDQLRELGALLPEDAATESAT